MSPKTQVRLGNHGVRERNRPSAEKTIGAAKAETKLKEDLTKASKFDISESLPARYCRLSRSFRTKIHLSKFAKSRSVSRPTTLLCS